MGKRGEKIFSIWWFAVLGVVAAGITVGLFMYYSADNSVKEIHADILFQRVLDCISDNGFLREDLFEGFDFAKECNFKKSVFDETDFYFDFTVDKNGVVSYFEFGDRNLKKECEISDSVFGKHLPDCVEEDVVFLYGSELSEAKVSILTASNQEGNKFQFLDDE